MARTGTPPDPAEREVFDRKGSRLEGEAQLTHALRGRAALRPGHPHARQVALHVGREHRNAGAESCSAIVCRVIVLPVPVAPAMRP